LAEIDAQAAEHIFRRRWCCLLDGCIKKGAEQDRITAKARDKSGIDIAAQRWPQSPEYIWLDRVAERFARARKEIEAWSSESDRKSGLEMLYLYSHYGYEEQQELFTRRDNLPTVPRKIRDRVWDLLEHAP